MGCCLSRRRSLATKTPNLNALNRSLLAPSHPQVIPDFVVRLSAPYLRSTDIARMFSVDKICHNALSLPGLVREMGLLLGIEEDRLTTLAQLHLEEQLPIGANILNFEFMSTD